MHAPTFRRQHAWAQARARAYAQVCNLCCFSTAVMFRELVLMLRYTHIVCVFIKNRTGFNSPLSYLLGHKITQKDSEKQKYKRGRDTTTALL
jgi:hypothetical protein